MEARSLRAEGSSSSIGSRVSVPETPTAATTPSSEILRSSSGPATVANDEPPLYADLGPPPAYTPYATPADIIHPHLDEVANTTRVQPLIIPSHDPATDDVSRTTSQQNTQPGPSIGNDLALTVISETEQEESAPSLKPMTEEQLTVYTDGACRTIGEEEATAGIGAWFGRNDPRNLSERCPGPQTNNRAELIVRFPPVRSELGDSSSQAIIHALEQSPRTLKTLKITSDSKYTILCITKFLPVWLQNGFRTAPSGAVKNREVIEYISTLLEMWRTRGTQVSFEWVRSNDGSEGNVQADKLANKGILLPERAMDLQWASKRRRLLTVLKSLPRS